MPTAKVSPPAFHPMIKVADALADHVRAVENPPPPPAPVAWITNDGDLYCAACVDPTLEQRAQWEPVRLPIPNTRPDACDICGAEVEL